MIAQRLSRDVPKMLDELPSLRRNGRDQEASEVSQRIVSDLAAATILSGGQPRRAVDVEPTIRHLRIELDERRAMVAEAHMNGITHRPAHEIEQDTALEAAIDRLKAHNAERPPESAPQSEP